MARAVGRRWTLVAPVLLLAVFLPEGTCACSSCPEVLQQCSSRECFTCGHVPASCDIDEDNRTISCTADTQSCSYQTCDECHHCTLLFLQFKGNWTFRSLCVPYTCVDIREDMNTVCQRRLTNEDCRFFRNDRNEGFPPSQFLCSCYGENCSSPLLPYVYTHPPSPPSPSPPPSSNASFTLTPSSTPLSSPLGSPIVSVPHDGDSTTPVYWIIIAVVVIVLVLAICSAFFIVRRVIIKHRGTQRPRPPDQTGLQNLSDEQDLPFQLVHMISRGRFGYVYRTQYEGELVAVKIFTYHNRQTWENERTIFSMESTKHRNIVEYIVSGSWGTGYQLQMFIMTPYYPLGSLNRFLARNTVSWEQACRVIHSVTSGLGHLHSESYQNNNGIVVEKYSMAHRDVKSANVLVRGENGDSVIADLGLALILDPASDAKDMANTGQVGTYRYMAPEVLDARVNLHDIQSFKQIDMYAMGLVMWEVLWRCNVQEEKQPREYMMPFKDLVGQHPEIDSMREVVCTQKLRPQIVTTWRNHPGLNSLVETMEECWDHDPEARLSAANVALRLKEVLDGGPTAIAHIHSPPHLPHPPVVPSDDRFRRRNVLESTADTIGTTDSRPPPYDVRWGYISTDRSGTFEMSQSQSRPRLQSSMPHIQADEGYNSYQYQAPPRSTRSLRNSAVCEGSDPFLRLEMRGGSLARHSMTNEVADPITALLSSTSTTGSSSPNNAHPALTHSVSEPLGHHYPLPNASRISGIPPTPSLSSNNSSHPSESSQYPSSRESSPERVYEVNDVTATDVDSDHGQVEGVLGGCHAASPLSNHVTSSPGHVIDHMSPESNTDGEHVVNDVQSNNADHTTNNDSMDAQRADH